MHFNSVEFLFLFLPISLSLFFLLARHSRLAALSMLAAASFFFYAQLELSFLFILVPSVLLNYATGLALTRIKDDGILRWRIACLGVSANLLCLFCFKYLDLAIHSLNALGSFDLAEQKIELPLGISFFTFTQIAFLVDAYQRKAQEPAFVNYALFVSYFPHLIAGPIIHHKEVMPQFTQAATFRISSANLAVGTTMFFIGLFKKVVCADTLAPHVHVIFDAAASGTALGALEAWSGALFYALQIYYDFSGYSDMAIGLSLLFGVKLPLNFNSPYQAENIIDFWRRWHMTLSRFLRDYLYFPLGGNRKGPARRLVNVMLVMVLGGLWHGASWTFAIWGALHGVFLVLNHAWHLAVGERCWGRSATRSAGMALTFVLVTIAWVFFRAPSVDVALAMLQGMAGQNGAILPTAAGASAAAPLLPSLKLLLIALLLQAVAWTCPNSQEILAAHPAALGAPTSRQRRWIAWAPNLRSALVVGVMASVALAIIAYTRRVGDFIYFQF